jgi:hypothetical protein
MYLHDRTRKEWLYITLLVKIVAEGSVALTSEQKQWIDDAIENCITELQTNDKHFKVAVSLINITLRKFVENAPDNIAGEKVAITLYCFLELLTAQNKLSLPENSKVAEIVDWIIGNIDYNNVTEKRIKNGNKVANQWLQALQGRSYFN